MVKKENVYLSKITWIHRGGVVDHFYEPENVEEFIEIINKLNKNQEPYKVIGHTSNLYFKNSFNIENIVSTRRLNSRKQEETYVKCDCGVSVSNLSKKMVAEGFKGFEGLVDLPGTVGAAIYGNAGCYHCALSDLLLKADVLMEDGSVRSVSPDEFIFSFRNSVLKSGQIKGYILNAVLRLDKGNVETLQSIAAANVLKRKLLSPPPSEYEFRYYLLSLRAKNKVGIYNR